MFLVVILDVPSREEKYSDLWNSSRNPEPCVVSGDLLNYANLDVRDFLVFGNNFCSMQVFLLVTGVKKEMSNMFFALLLDSDEPWKPPPCSL